MQPEARTIEARGLQEREKRAGCGRAEGGRLLADSESILRGRGGAAAPALRVEEGLQTPISDAETRYEDKIFEKTAAPSFTGELDFL